MFETTQTTTTTAEPIDLDLARTEWRLLGAVERYKAVCLATGGRPTSVDAWLVFLSELVRGQDLRLDVPPAARPAPWTAPPLVPVAVAA